MLSISCISERKLKIWYEMDEESNIFLTRNYPNKAKVLNWLYLMPSFSKLEVPWLDVGKPEFPESVPWQPEKVMVGLTSLFPGSWIVFVNSLFAIWKYISFALEKLMVNKLTHGMAELIDQIEAALVNILHQDNSCTDLALPVLLVNGKWISFLDKGGYLPRFTCHNVIQHLIKIIKNIDRILSNIISW